jgi:FKBP-type peptidyl-prolyl cis-trans isomerase
MKMKKYFTATLLLVAFAAGAQKKTGPVKTTAPKTTVQSGVLKNKIDSISYAIGLNVADFYTQQGIKNLNGAMVSKAITDVTAGKKRLMTESEANLALMSHSNPKLAENVKTGERFLAANKTKAGVKTTASGLQYEVLVQGRGPKPAATDTVTVNYAGTLLNGTEFDNSYKRNEPATFPLNGVIKGWTEALQLMPVGSKYKFYIPYQSAYGLNDNGPIPGGSLLVFEIELLNISGKK